ncbi:tetratricopeptide repeat protein [Streptomyces sp. NPDC091266]|uniref:serine/threonine-protein kinase n=1 Tax=Streptomyces sp. NPDC091266 TaxID=3365978 RepID=UPI0037F781BD
MAENRVIQGRYRLLAVIGRGGMGEVWRADDDSLGRQVAVKCFKPMGAHAHNTAALRGMRERFRREARVAAGLQHRGITVVHDFGEEDGTLFLVMELLTGRDLRRLLADNGREPLPLPDVIEIAEQLTAALAYTHGQDVVHRDLKPANIMRSADGTVKILDFGIARLGADLGFTSRLTHAGNPMGSLHYMSPEQIGDDTIDHRTDLYSLGCVLYELITGRRLFEMDDTWPVIVAHRSTAPDPPRALRPELPEAYERIVLDLLAKKPDDRPADAGELGARLAEARRHAAPHGMAESGSLTLATERLPSWTRGITIGSAASTRVPRHSRPARAALLTHSWTGGREVARHHEADPHDARTAASGDRAAAGRFADGQRLAGLGRWEEAAEVYRAVAEEREQLLGRDHPDALAAHLETATALGELGRHFEAHQICAAVLADRERTLGPDHRDTLSCRHLLACGLRRLGRLEDSRAMACAVAEARARVLGARHAETLATRFEIACVLGQLGKWDQALEVCQEVAAARAEVLGPGHPDTLATRYDVGIGLGRLGRNAEALELYRDLVTARTHTQGADDPETLRARQSLGVSLGRLGRWEDALIEARSVATARARVLGADHPDTLVSRREVAVALGWLGRWAEALSSYHQVAEARERILGAAHLDVLASRTEEAQCLEQLGRSAEAAALHSRVAALRQERAERSR